MVEECEIWAEISGSIFGSVHLPESFTQNRLCTALIMVAQAPSGKKPLPDMMTSIRITEAGEVEIVDQLLLP